MRAKTEIQVYREKFHTHIYLDYAKLEFLSCIKKIKNKNFYSLKLGQNLATKLVVG